MDRLEQIKENRFMPYGALGVVAIKAEDRDWLIQEVEKLRILSKTHEKNRWANYDLAVEKPMKREITIIKLEDCVEQVEGLPRYWTVKVRNDEGAEYTPHIKYAGEVVAPKLSLSEGLRLRDLLREKVNYGELGFLSLLRAVEDCFG